jgi:hypothetical protein
MSTPGIQQDDSARIGDDLARRQKSMVSLSGLRRLLERWGGTIFMLLVLGAGTIGLVRFGIYASKQEHKLAAGDSSGSGVIVRTEVVCVWLPQTMIELAKSEAMSPVLSTHEDVRRLLERRGLEGMWYAVAIRGHQASGRFIDMQFVRRPFIEPDLFPQFLEILASAGSEGRDQTSDDFTATSVQTLPDRLAKLESRDAIAVLQREPNTLVVE